MKTVNARFDGTPPVVISVPEFVTVLWPPTTLMARLPDPLAVIVPVFTKVLFWPRPDACPHAAVMP